MSHSLFSKALATPSALIVGTIKTLRGRTTAFAAFFAVTAFVLALLAKLTWPYVSVITAVGAYVNVRAIAQDYHDRQSNNGGDVPNPK